MVSVLVLLFSLIGSGSCFGSNCSLVLVSRQESKGIMSTFVLSLSLLLLRLSDATIKAGVCVVGLVSSFVSGSDSFGVNFSNLRNFTVCNTFLIFDLKRVKSVGRSRDVCSSASVVAVVLSFIASSLLICLCFSCFVFLLSKSLFIEVCLSFRLVSVFLPRNCSARF